MKVKQKPSDRPEWRPGIGAVDQDGINNMSGFQLVKYACRDVVYSPLMNIVGKLIDKLPESDRLAVCGLEDFLEYCPHTIYPQTIQRKFIGQKANEPIQPSDDSKESEE